MVASASANSSHESKERAASASLTFHKSISQMSEGGSNHVLTPKPSIDMTNADARANELLASWLDENAVKIINEYESRLNALPLPSEILKRGLSQIGLSPDGMKHVYQKLTLPHSELTDISALRDYPYIQLLELQGNKIEDVSPLKAMRYLVQLDLSSNKLTRALDISPPPFNLQQIDLSRNMISTLNDLSSNRFLANLNLDHNTITSLEGLANCKSLKHLKLSQNLITSISDLKGLRLQTLDVSHNKIQFLDIVDTMKDLQELNVSHNAIQSIENIKGHPNLRALNAEYNLLDELSQIQILENLTQLRTLRISENPITKLPASTWLAENKTTPMHLTATFPPSYRLKTVFWLQQLTVLDALPVSPEEKIAAVNAYDPLQNVIASSQHAHSQKRQARAYARIKAEDLMRARRLRPVVLFGPNGAGKRTLTNRLLQEFPHIYGLSVSHTTRKPRAGEENGVHYHFVTKEEMSRMNDEGKFIEIVSLFGNMYGTSMDSVDKVTEEGKICIMDLELEGVLALRKSHLKPRYIYVKTPNFQVLQKRLESRNTIKGTATEFQAIWKKADTILEDQFPNEVEEEVGTNKEQHSTAAGGADLNASIQDDVTAHKLKGDDFEFTIEHSESNANPTYHDKAVSHGPVSTADSQNNYHSHQSSILENSFTRDSISNTPAETGDFTEKQVADWIAKAERVDSMDVTFDLQVVNDDLENAYRELKDYCLSAYWKDFEEED